MPNDTLSRVCAEPDDGPRRCPFEPDAHHPIIGQAIDEDAVGITIRGAKLLGTSSIMANEVLVANLQPLKPGEEALAFSCALPMNSKGLRVLSRKSYEAAAVSVFDNPLSSRFDENDALLYFEDVKVPWERVFVHRDTDMCRAQFHDTPAHAYQTCVDIASLAPNAEVTVYPWKEPPELKARTINRVRKFLKAHVPASVAR